MRTPLGLYLHIPFCRTKCPYCDFLSTPIPDTVPETFVTALCDEISQFKGPAEADTIFFGGGTPSLLDLKALERILEALERRFLFSDPEITIEVNPDDVTPSLVRAWSELGINRVSIGVQSFDDRVLQYLGRRHDAASAHHACEWVSKQFANWGMDLIFGAFPDKGWETTLNDCQTHAPAHVSTYGLTYENGTPFEQRAGNAIRDTEWLQLYRAADALLAGYTHYEISNFARPGFECLHNLLYWHNESYAGFGPGAYSFLENTRLRNVTDYETYLACPGKKVEALALSDREVRIETVIQHLRLKEGLPRSYYAGRFGVAVEEDFGGELASLQERELIEIIEDRYCPTRKGYELNNEIGLALV